MAADMFANFLAGKHQCEPTEYFGAFATTSTSQRLAYQFKLLLLLLPFGRNLKGEFYDPKFRGLGEC